jgi:maltose alpha-D-glucosyltransferase / alpha-amylase
MSEVARPPEPAVHWFESNPLWFKTAVFYEIHTRAFFDGNDDGSGDFRGLQAKLDYLQWLGIDCIWLLPFYPSPLKDGGYDIADFYGINPDYGVVEDFRAFVEAAHERGMRVIVDLVMNHTSSDHPWFQASRDDPDGPYGDFYVWSDTDEPYRDARIIFIDTEISNWTHDPVRGQYYWHRFFSHQPDLNYENPRVQDAMIEVLRFWLDVGLDGFRLDAVPYLFEEEGTNCENLPRTHEYLKRVRAEVDANYPDRVLLAEANQWPEDVVAYFGDGDECHMAFHFPVMPRMFMSLRREEALPMIEILDRTPAIPQGAQWGLFLRNHDELTLEMVTDEERDYMYAEYAKDPRMKLNLGIRRRLAPLLDGGRDEIQLMHAILFSLPGSPVLYYGDEIGMGDNVFLGDRDGVRTPMHWTGDRNGGFSRADFAQLYLPPLMDPVYGFQAVNVEAQLRLPTSLLRWMRRFIELRKEHPVFGLGDYRVIRPENTRIFAHIRSFSEDIILCVHNLARTAQAVELDLSAFNGRVPVELFGNTEFPAIGELPYLLTLGPRGFFWFQLKDPADDER